MSSSYCGTTTRLRMHVYNRVKSMFLSLVRVREYTMKLLQFVAMEKIQKNDLSHQYCVNACLAFIYAFSLSCLSVTINERNHNLIFFSFLSSSSLSLNTRNRLFYTNYTRHKAYETNSFSLLPAQKASEVAKEKEKTHTHTHIRMTTRLR